MRYEAVILCGGEGWRLKPATWTPKPLLEISPGQTLVDRQIQWLLGHGFSNVVLASNRALPEATFFNNKAVQLCLEKEKLGTGGAVKKASSLVQNEKFYAMNVDDIVFYDPRKLFEYSTSGAAVLLAKPQLRFGRVATKKDLVTRFEQKPIMNLWVNVGHYVFSKELVKEYFPDKGNLERTTMQEIADKRYLRALKYKGDWLTVNTLKDLMTVKEYFGAKEERQGSEPVN